MIFFAFCLSQPPIVSAKNAAAPAADTASAAAALAAGPALAAAAADADARARAGLRSSPLNFTTNERARIN